MGLVDAAGNHDGLVRDLLDLLGQARGVARVDLHRRHDVDGALQCGGIAGSDRVVVEAIDVVGLEGIEVADEVEDFGGDETVLGLLLA